jgi:hypothetical protein
MDFPSSSAEGSYGMDAYGLKGYWEGALWMGWFRLERKIKANYNLQTPDSASLPLNAWQFVEWRGQSPTPIDPPPHSPPPQLRTLIPLLADRECHFLYKYLHILWASRCQNIVNYQWKQAVICQLLITMVTNLRWVKAKSGSLCV